MAATLVLEASAERRESSSLSLRTTNNSLPLDNAGAWGTKRQGDAITPVKALHHF